MFPVQEFPVKSRVMNVQKTIKIRPEIPVIRFAKSDIAGCVIKIGHEWSEYCIMIFSTHIVHIEYYFIYVPM